MTSLQIFVFAALCAHVYGTCPTNFELHNGNCYYVDTTAEASWNDAKRHCENKQDGGVNVDAKLATIYNSDENAYIQGMLENTNSGVNGWLCNLGNSDNWCDHSSMNYKNLMQNLDFPLDVGDCLSMKGTAPNKGKWMDTACSSGGLHPVCKIVMACRVCRKGKGVGCINGRGEMVTPPSGTCYYEMCMKRQYLWGGPAGNSPCPPRHGCLDDCGNRPDGYSHCNCHTHHCYICCSPNSCTTSAVESSLQSAYACQCRGENCPEPETP